jgi:hypothetical protein
MLQAFWDMKQPSYSYQQHEWWQQQQQQHEEHELRQRIRKDCGKMDIMSVVGESLSTTR